MSFPLLKTFSLAIISTFLAVAIILFPQESLQASVYGMTMWWNIVFPSLLPFFIMAELLIGFGVVSLIGVLIEPFMRPIFRVPGVGGFVWAMGLASGNPVGAKITARLRQQNKLTQIEAERLVSFTNSANPLFMFGAVAVGFFHNATLGILFACAHYLGNFCVGIIMRYYGKENRAIRRKKRFIPIQKGILIMHEERLRDGRSIGKLLGDAVHSSIFSLLMIGGFIILFSVINEILSLMYVTNIFAFFITTVLTVFQLPNELSVPFISGLFEMTIGSKLTSETSSPLIAKAIIISFLLAFSGFSIQAQVASILAETDIRFIPFFISRIIHGMLAAIFTYVLWKPLYMNRLQSDGSGEIAPVFLRSRSLDWLHYSWVLLNTYGHIITFISLVIFIFIFANRTLQKIN